MVDRLAEQVEKFEDHDKFNISLTWVVEAFFWMQVCMKTDYTYIRMNTSNPHDFCTGDIGGEIGKTQSSPGFDCEI